MFVNILVQIATREKQNIKAVFSMVVLRATHNLVKRLFHDTLSIFLNVVVVALVAAVSVSLGSGRCFSRLVMVSRGRSSRCCLRFGISFGSSLGSDLLSGSLLSSGLC